jgi:hypothetical protein
VGLVSASWSGERSVASPSGWLLPVMPIPENREALVRGTNSIGSGVCGFTHDLSGAWQGRNGNHVWEKRCSGLDLLGCDPGSGYAARGFNTRETELAYRSPRLRDDARVASPSSPCVCRIVGAPPLCTPARVIPGRTLLEGGTWVGYRASPQVQGTPFFRWWWPAGVPVPVPAETQSVQCF